MSITHRKGEEEDFDPSKMVSAEWAFPTNGKCYYCVSPGVVKEVITKEDFQAIFANIEDVTERAEVAIAIAENIIISKIGINDTVASLTEAYSGVKSESLFTSAKAYADGLFNDITQFQIAVVSVLPTVNISTSTIYFVAKTAETGNNFDEYMYINGAWEHLGGISLDLSGYATDQDLLDAIDDINTLLSGKANAVHNHAISDVTGLQTALDGKADVGTVGGTNDVIFRNILRLKMRETGLNLDENAWSDSLEDASGINAGLSSGYTFDAVGKSLKVAAGGETIAITQAVGASPTAFGFNPAGEKLEQGQTFTANSTLNGVTSIKVVLKTGVKTGNQPSGAVKIYTTSGGLPTTTALGSVSFARNALTENAENSFSISLSSPLVNGTVYAIAVEPTEVLSANNFINLMITNSSVYTGGTYIYSTNDAAWNNAGGTYEMYFKVYAISTVTNATVIWNSTTSLSVLTKMAIETIQSLGTGTITYYISRDGSTTYTECEESATTSITSQPSGTTIVLKVVITGNAELLAIAWGGE